VRSAVVIIASQVPSLPDGDQDGAILAIAAAIALLVGIFIVFAPEIDMGWLRRRTTGDALQPAAALQLAQMANRAAMARALAVTLGGTLVIAVAGNPLAPFVVIGAGLAVTRQIWVIQRARHMLRLLDERSTVMLHGDHVLCVATTAASSWLVCTQRQLAIAADRVLPAAIVVKN
jgi:hypothetical protein